MTDALVNDELVHLGAEPTGSSTTHGAPAESDRNSLSLAPNGPLLPHDVHLVDTLAGALNGVRDDVLHRALRYWRNDETTGQRIADQVNETVELDGSTASGSDTGPEEPSKPEEVVTS